MKISSLSINSVSKAKIKSAPVFKSNSDKNQSRQNNSVDFFLDRNFYYQLLGIKASQAAKKAGMLNEDKDDLIAKFNGFVLDVANGNQDELLLNASIKINQIKLNAYSLGLPPKDIENDVPHFVNIKAGTYIDDLYFEADSLQKTAYSIMESDNMYSLEIQTEDSSYHKMLDNDDIRYQFENAAESLRVLCDYFRLHPSELQESLNLLSRAYDYKIYQMLMNGFNSNPREVLLALSNGLLLSSKPKISKDSKGSLIMKYDTPKGDIIVKRNPDNFDYISASMSNSSGDETFDVEFSEDGSIRSLTLINSFDDSNIYITQDKESNIATVSRYYNNELTTKRFAFKDNKIIEIA